MRRVSGAGLRIKSAMTCDEPRRVLHRHSRVGGNPQGGSEGDSVGCFVLLYAPPFTSGLRIKSAMVVCAARRPFHRHSRVGGNPQGGGLGSVILASRQYP